MSLYTDLALALDRAQRTGRLPSIVIGVVTNNEDPDNQGRVKVKFPWLADNEESTWARLVVPMAGKERGFFFIPEVDDEVVVAFEHGQADRPYVLGSLWNGVDLPPTDAGDGRDQRVLKSRSGHILRLGDKDGEEKVEIIDKTGNNKIIIDTSGNTITISSDKDIELKAPQGKVLIDAKEFEIKSSAAGKVEAGGTLTVKGSTVNIN